jgi:hypothetical protein
MKTCTKCLVPQLRDEFGTQKSSPDGLRYECKTCQRQYMAAWRSRNREYLRDASSRRWEKMSEDEKARKREMDHDRYHADPAIVRDKLMRRKYGIGQQQYDEMLAHQNGVCAICGDEPDGRILHVDHHHVSGVVRGLLCTRCNTGLGQFRDSPDFLSHAIAYLLNT